MTHWKAYKEGKISLKVARELQMLKNRGDRKSLQEYHRKEKKYGIK